MASPEVQIDVALETKRARQELQKLNKATSGFASDFKKKFKTVDIAIGSFVGNLASNAIAGAFSLIGKGFASITIGAIKAAAETEKLKTQFEVLTGSQEKASILFAELTKFSASTPFQLNNIAEASAQLLSFGFASEGVTERIKSIGEVAAGSNSDLKDVALIYGQVSAAGKLTGERLLQLQERAVPIGAALAKSLGVAESEVKDLVSQGVVGFKEFEQAFNSMSQSGGIFEGAINKQSKTINGSLSTLSDNFEILKTSIGDIIAPAVLLGIQGLTELIQDFNRAVTGGTASEKLQDISGQIIRLRENLKNTNRLEIISRNSGQNIDQVTASINRQIISLQGRATELAKGQKIEGPSQSDTAGKEREEENKKILEGRRTLAKDLALIQQDAQIKEAEIKLVNDELTTEQRAAEIEKITEFQNNKSKTILDFDKITNDSIRDSEQKKLADQIANAKSSLAITKNEEKSKAIIRNEALKAEQLRLSAYSTIISNASALAKQGSREAKVLAIAQATINTYAGASRALVDYPAPLSYAVAGSVIAAGIANVGKITSAGSYANGGFIGGSSSTGDNLTANVNKNEVILNSRQQNEFMKVANGNGGSSGELSGKIDELIAVMSSQPVNVMIDGREVFKAVREQQLARGA